MGNPIKEYAKGFHYGYRNFETKIKLTDAVFSQTDESVANNVYLETLGKNKYVGSMGVQWSEKYQNSIVTKESMYWKGIESGEFAKGLGLILNNPLVFEPIFNIYATKEKHTQNHNSIDKKENKETIDFSETKGTEKIIFLKQLGIFDFLRKQQPFNASKNALASAISGVTGIKASTVQSYINPINNLEADQKNNPLNTEKTVQKVNNKLLSIGYKPPK